jgi:hypothetical protein
LGKNSNRIAHAYFCHTRPDALQNASGLLVNTDATASSQAHPDSRERRLPRYGGSA